MAVLSNPGSKPEQCKTNASDRLETAGHYVRISRHNHTRLRAPPHAGTALVAGMDDAIVLGTVKSLSRAQGGLAA